MQVCGPAAGHEAAAPGQRRGYAARDGRAGLHLPAQAAAAAGRHPHAGEHPTRMDPKTN